MIAGLSLGSDARRYFRFWLPKIAVITVVAMPLMYGALYLWAFWDPFNHVDRIPVALVNSDEGTTVAGQELDAGEQVAKNLMDSGQLDLTLLSADEAEARVADGTYYFMIEIPEDFSASLTSALTGEPRQAKLTFTFNDANNYLSTVIGQDAAYQVISRVNSGVAEQGLEQVLVVVQGGESFVGQVREGIADLAERAQIADDAVQEIAGGVDEISGVLDVASEDAAGVATHVEELSGAVDTISERLLGLVEDGGLQPLVGEEISRVLDDAETLVDSVAVLAADDLDEEATQLLDDAASALRDTGDPALADLADGLDDLGEQIGAVEWAVVTAALDGLRSDVANLEQIINDPDGPLHGPLQQLDEALAAAVTTLDEGFEDLAAGAGQVSDGISMIAQGGDEIADGVDELAADVAGLDERIQEVAADLEDALTHVPGLTDEQREDLAQTLATPVALEQDNMNEAPTFGTGFAPFFVSLALFVGGIIIWMVLLPNRPRPTASGIGAFRTVFISYWPALIAGSLQAILLFTVVTLAVGLRPQHALGMVLFMILISATFLAMIQALNVVLGQAVGRVTTLALLMVMLVSSGGIYPVETTARPFQVIHPFDPVSYTVTGLRQLTVAVPVDGRLWISIGVLVALLVACLAASALAVSRNRVYTMTRLYPMVEV